MNGKEYGFQKQLSEVNSFSDVPGWCSGEKMEFLQQEIRKAYNRIPPASEHWFEMLDLGSWKGRSASAQATALPTDRPFYVWCVDHWLGSPGERETNHIQAGIRPLSVLWEFYQYTSHLGLLGKKIGVITAPSATAVDYFDDGQFSFMFIDGDHENAYDDLVRWLPKLKIGGTLIGDDYEWPLVKRDVERFVNEFGDHYGLQFSTHNVNAWAYRFHRTRG